jgi:hypothetical protein
MNRPWLMVALLAFLHWPVLAPAQQQQGSVCVAPNPEEPPTRVSPGQMYNPATLKIRIDKREALPWPHKNSLKIDGLDLNGRHLLVVTSDGKPIQSLKFSFSHYKSSELCVYFDGYQGVQLDERKHAPWCKCK